MPYIYSCVEQLVDVLCEKEIIRGGGVEKNKQTLHRYVDQFSRTVSQFSWAVSQLYTYSDSTQ